MPRVSEYPEDPLAIGSNWPWRTSLLERFVLGEAPSPADGGLASAASGPGDDAATPPPTRLGAAACGLELELELLGGGLVVFVGFAVVGDDAGDGRAGSGGDDGRAGLVDVTAIVAGLGASRGCFDEPSDTEVEGGTDVAAGFGAGFRAGFGADCGTAGADELVFAVRDVFCFFCAFSCG